MSDGLSVPGGISPACPLCMDRGFLTYDVPYGHPLFATLKPCPRCKGDGQSEVWAAPSGLPPRLQAVIFDRVVRHPGNAAAYDECVERATRPHEFLTLAGPTGVGKSTLLAATVNEARAVGVMAYYTTTADLLDGLRATFKPDAAGNYEAEWERLKGVRVLCIDELERFNPSDWAMEKLFQLISVRYDYGSDRLTCFATNANLDTYPAYLQSRMRDRQCGLFELAGMDVRLRAR